MKLTALVFAAALTLSACDHAPPSSTPAPADESPGAGAEPQTVCPEGMPAWKCDTLRREVPQTN